MRERWLFAVLVASGLLVVLWAHPRVVRVANGGVFVPAIVRRGQGSSVNSTVTFSIVPLNSLWRSAYSSVTGVASSTPTSVVSSAEKKNGVVFSIRPCWKFTLEF